MKTRLFHHITRDPEVRRKFLDDLFLVLDLDANQRDACALGVLEVSDELTERQRLDITKRIAEENSMTLPQTLSALKFTQFFLEALSTEGYKNVSTIEIVEDLKECSASTNREVTATQADDFRSFLETLTEKTLGAFESAVEDKEVASGLLPSLRYFGTTVEIRAVISNPFRIGMTADDTYDPKIQRVVPVITVKLRTASAVDSELFFSASETEMEALIEEMKSSLTSLKCLKEFLGVAESDVAERTGSEEQRIAEEGDR